MTQTLNPVITITVSGAESSGKNRVLAIIEEALRYHLGRDIIIDAPALHTKRETHTDWSKPRSGTIFKLEEINLSENPLSRRICSMSYSEVVRLFAKYKFKDPIGHSLLSCDDFLELLELAFNHRDKSTGEITPDDLINRSVPAPIQAFMDRLSVSMKTYQEADLQPVIDLVNWALAEDAKNIPEEEPDATMLRKHAVDKLINAMSFNGEVWSTPAAVHATIAALLTLYDQPLVLMELRKVLYSL